MAVGALLGLFALPLDEEFHVDNGAPLAALLAVVAFVWAALAGTASVLAIRNAKATSDVVRLAWSAVPAALLLGAPFAVNLLAEHDYTEDDAVCSPGLLPAGVTTAIFGWIPWAFFPSAAVATALLGLGCLVPKATRRPGAWILVSTLLVAGLAISSFALVVNHCD